MNLLKETIEVLAEHGKTPADVAWIGCRDVWFTWDDFAELADREYDNGWGVPEVAPSLVVVGDGWHLGRREYDGREWWAFVDLTKPETYHKPGGLFPYRQEG